MLRAVKQRRDELNALVNGAYTEKDDVYNKHITALEAIDFDSEAAFALVEATMATATPVELLERKQLFVKGLTQFKQHEVPLKPSCSSNMTIKLQQSFEQSVAAIRAIGTLDAGETDPVASTAEGEGLVAAKVGEAAAFVVTAVEVGSADQRGVGGDNVVVKLVCGVVDEGAAPSDSSASGGAAAKPDIGNPWDRKPEAGCCWKEYTPE